MFLPEPGPSDFIIKWTDLEKTQSQDQEMISKFLFELLLL